MISLNNMSIPIDDVIGTGKLIGGDGVWRGTYIDRGPLGNSIFFSG